MKKLEVNQMEALEGGGKPSAGQVTCFLISVGYSLLNPLPESSQEHCAFLWISKFMTYDK